MSGSLTVCVEKQKTNKPQKQHKANTFDHTLFPFFKHGKKSTHRFHRVPRIWRQGRKHLSTLIQAKKNKTKGSLLSLSREEWIYQWHLAIGTKLHSQVVSKVHLRKSSRKSNLQWEGRADAYCPSHFHLRHHSFARPQNSCAALLLWCLKGLRHNNTSEK